MFNDLPRHVCTKEDPWTPEKSDKAYHPNATSELDTDYGEWFYCPICNTRFYVEHSQ